MADGANFDDWFEMPGGDDLIEVTDLFVAGTHDMEDGEVLLMDGYTILDAMSAFEIGEPRLDSGMILDEQRRPPFDPLTPLLPEEVCWLLDRSFACEMEWHAGKMLSQSVFTILFVHHMPDINPDYLPPEEDADPSRPRWLITVVLRAGLLGLLKSCDLAWRELSKNRVHEVEDWHAEKCDVSLLEGIDTGLIVHMLDAACKWVQQSDLRDDHIAALCDRLLLRSTLLHFMSLDLFQEVHELWFNLNHARDLVHQVRTSCQEDLPPESPALLAMDQHIPRRLPNFTPIRVTDLPPMEQCWDALDSLFEYWGEIANLLSSPSLFRWKVAGSLQHALNKKTPVAFQRSLVQTLFYDKDLVLGSRRSTWLVDQFFYETIGIPYTTVQQYLELYRPQGLYSTKQDVIERRIIKIMIPRIRSSWYNPPRRRRHLMKEVLQWHMLHDMILSEVNKCKGSDSEAAAVLAAIPRAALIWRLTASRDIILSGFQQELYAREEIPIAYWYLACVLEAHLSCIEDLLPVTPPSASAYLELRFQADHLAALQMISTTLAILTAGYIVFPLSRLSLNCNRRYKWALNRTSDSSIPAEPLPDLQDFPVLLEASQHGLYSPAATFQLAQDILTRLGESTYEWVGPWAHDRKQYLSALADVCGRLKGVAPESTLALPNFDSRTFEWIPTIHPWFPTVSTSL